jgi:hypothetical protein
MEELEQQRMGRRCCYLLVVYIEECYNVSESKSINH